MNIGFFAAIPFIDKLRDNLVSAGFPIQRKTKYRGLTEIKNDCHKITYNPETGIIVCSGRLGFWDREAYAHIAEFFKNITQSKAQNIILDIRELQFLSTPGITTLGGFIINVREKGESRLKILGSGQHPWQTRILKRLKNFMPDMKLEFE